MRQDDDILWILRHCRTVAVVGLSPKPHRDSYQVARYMQARGWRIVPVNPMAAGQTILGEAVYPSLAEAARHEHIELVNCFRNSADIPPIVEEAIAIGAPAVWMQLGVEHEAAAERARQAGLRVVQNRCLKIDHAQNPHHE
ncbi:MAG: CoA-binding protein [Hylemonella sp.]|nr:CoA-binding protein [Hylemonella sp.]